MKPEVVVPFADLLAPIARDALRSVELSPVLERAFTSYLQQRLADVLGQSLYLHFHARRFSFCTFHGSRDGCYQAFVSDARQRGLSAMLQATPVAVQAIEILSQQVCRFAETFSEHLRADAEAIASLLGTSELSEPSDASFGWSDPHCGGLSVGKVSFANGAAVYYKPRSMAVDQVWARGLAQFDHPDYLTLRAARVLDCGDHGWSEAISSRIKATETEALNCFRRFGALLCIAWLLDAVDLHRDNFVVDGDNPVLVDPECLLHTLMPKEKLSLSRTLMVPDSDYPWDFSVLGETNSQTALGKIRWHRLESDELNLTLEPEVVPAATHLPRVNGLYLPRQMIASAVQDGFIEMSLRTRARRELIDDWRAELRGVERRVLYRSTLFYAYILRFAAHPASLASLQAWHDEVTGLLGRQLPSAVLSSEMEQLRQWDIPVFRNNTSSVIPAQWNSLDNEAAGLYALLSR